MKDDPHFRVELKIFLMHLMARDSGVPAGFKDTAKYLHRKLTEPELFPSGTDTHSDAESGSESKS
jgi:hypothetical protein